FLLRAIAGRSVAFAAPIAVVKTVATVVIGVAAVKVPVAVTAEIPSVAVSATPSIVAATISGKCTARDSNCGDSCCCKRNCDGLLDKILRHGSLSSGVVRQERRSLCRDAARCIRTFVAHASENVRD